MPELWRKIAQAATKVGLPDIAEIANYNATWDAAAAENDRWDDLSQQEKADLVGLWRKIAQAATEAGLPDRARRANDNALNVEARR
jgi:hypothetical protein